MLPESPTATGLATPFQRLRLSGLFSEEIFLVDNQVADGRTGYWVVQLFEDQSGARLLVNRGFVVAPRLRAELPLISTPPGPVSLKGVVWPFTGLIPVLDDDIWPDR